MSYILIKQPADFTQSASVTVANTTAATTLLGAGGPSLVATGEDFLVGKTYRITACGVYSTSSTPNLTMTVKLGSSTVLATAANATASGASNNVWKLEGILTVQTLGSSGTIIGQGTFTEAGVATHAMANSSAVTINTNNSLTFNLTATWGTGSTSNTITLTNFILEELN